MVNDSSIILGLIIFFVALGGLLPFIQEDFNQGVNDNNVEQITSNINVEDAGSAVSALNVLGSIISMFFWTFGSIPIWLDLILFIPLRILLAFIIARNVWVGGGA